MRSQAIQFGDPGQLATREMLRRFATLAAALPPGFEALRQRLATLETIDRQHGGGARLDLEDAHELVAAIHQELAQGQAEALGRAASAAIADLAIGVALWAQRHGVALVAVEPVANALALRSNRAASKPELRAVFALMQGVIASVAPRLAADSERSNPQRAWRILHLNFAITAIRSEEPALIDFAFDALEQALPDERCGFYAEALALALAPGVASGVRERIAARHLKWTAP